MVAACGLRVHGPENEKLCSVDDILSEHRPPRMASAPAQLFEECAQVSSRANCYQRATYDTCPNYFPALDMLEEALGCSGVVSPSRATPASSPRQQRCHRSFRGCKVCSILRDGSGPFLDWARDSCYGKADEGGRAVHCCYQLCSRESNRVLASVLLHEAVHVCQERGFGERGNECQPAQAEEACLGTPFTRKAGFCFPIP